MHLKELQPSAHFFRLNTQFNDVLMDSSAVSIYLTLHISWNIYNLGQYLLMSVITVQVPSPDINYQSCYEMAFALNFPKVGMIL